MRSLASGPCLGALTRGLRSGTSPISSTSCEACQKNRYGLMVVPRMATTVVQNATSAENVGTKNPRATSPQGTLTTSAVPKYANKANVSHFKTETYRAYCIATWSTALSTPKPATYRNLGPPTSKLTASPMAPRSAPMLIVL